MKKILFTTLFSFAFLAGYAQDYDKASLCQSGAFSLVHSIGPLVEYKLTKPQVEEAVKGSFTAVTYPSIGKTYDLLSSGTSRKEAIRLIYLDFMLLDDDTVKKGFIKESVDNDD